MWYLRSETRWNDNACGKLDVYENIDLQHHRDCLVFVSWFSQFVQHPVYRDCINFLESLLKRMLNAVVFDIVLRRFLIIIFSSNIDFTCIFFVGVCTILFATILIKYIVSIVGLVYDLFYAILYTYSLPKSSASVVLVDIHFYTVFK